MDAGAGTQRHPEGRTTRMLTILDRHTVGSFLRARGVEAWGVAANDPPLPLAPALPRALSILMRIDPAVSAA